MDILAYLMSQQEARQGRALWESAQPLMSEEIARGAPGDLAAPQVTYNTFEGGTNTTTVNTSVPPFEMPTFQPPNYPQQPQPPNYPQQPQQQTPQQPQQQTPQAPKPTNNFNPYQPPPIWGGGVSSGAGGGYGAYGGAYGTKPYAGYGQYTQTGGGGGWNMGGATNQNVPQSFSDYTGAKAPPGGSWT